MFSTTSQHFLLLIVKFTKRTHPKAGIFPEIFSKTLSETIPAGNVGMPCFSFKFTGCGKMDFLLQVFRFSYAEEVD